MKFVAREPDDSVNVSSESPLLDFAHLAIVVGLAGLFLYLALGWIGAAIGSRMSMEKEVSLGRYFFDGENPEESPKQVDRYLNEQMESLCKLRESIPVVLPVSLMQQEDPNAFIAPGGWVCVTEGLLQRVQSENELNFVLAHELGHFYHRHVMRNLGRMTVFLVLSAAIGVGQDSGRQNGFLGNVFNTTGLHYSRENENEADSFALNLVNDKYGHIEGALNFFESIDSEEEGGALSEYFSTHPQPKNRISDLRKIADEKGWVISGKVISIPKELQKE